MCFANEKRAEPLGYEPNVLTTTLSSQNNFKLKNLKSKLNVCTLFGNRSKREVWSCLLQYRGVAPVHSVGAQSNWFHKCQRTRKRITQKGITQIGITLKGITQIDITEREGGVGRGMGWGRGEGLAIAAESKTKLAPAGTRSADSDFRAYFCYCQSSSKNRD